MNTHANDRATVDADPATESWLYRSEAFAEDLDDEAPAAVPAPRPTRRAAVRAAPWSAALAGLWQARAQGAR